MNTGAELFDALNDCIVNDEPDRFLHVYNIMMMDSTGFERLDDDENTKVWHFTDGYMMEFNEEYLSDVRCYAWCVGENPIRGFKVEEH